MDAFHTQLVDQTQNAGGDDGLPADSALELIVSSYSDKRVTHRDHRLYSRLPRLRVH